MTTAPAAMVRPALLTRLLGRGSLLRELIARPLGLLGLVIVTSLVIMAIFAPLIAPHDPNALDVTARYQGPSTDHPLGTDSIGRDLFSRLIFGARIALEVAIPAVAAGFAVGLLVGLAAGYLGRWVDTVVLVILDTLLSLPAVILAFALVTLFGPSLRNTIVLISLALVPGYARLARASVLAERQNQYVKAERALGASKGRILFRHLMPNIVPPLLILVAMDLPAAIAIEAGLSFLGLGVQPPTASWGVMLRDGFEVVRTHPWPLVGPLVALAVATIGFTLLGETLRDLTDPKLAGFRRWRRT